MQQQLNLFGNDTFNSEFSSLLRMIPSQEGDYVTHNIHPYPAKFLPHFPRLFIKYFSKKGDLIIDPMCGSGTTLVESCLLGRSAHGVDIDPVASLISKVSITPISEKDFLEYEPILINEIRDRLKNGHEPKVSIPSDEDFPNLDIWFREDVLKELLVIRDAIFDLDTFDTMRNFALLCLSTIIKPVSNADPRDIFPERDLKEKVRERKNVIHEFQRAFFDNKGRVLEFSQRVDFKVDCNVELGDARNVSLPDNSASLVFTSPPYAYAMDYARVHKLSTLLFIMSNKEFVEYRRRYIGTDRVSVNTELSSFDGIEFAQDSLKRVYKKDRKLGIILYQYFSDMHKVTKEAFRLIKPNGYLIYVVGNSTVKGTKFQTDEVYRDICKNLGFDIKKNLHRPYYAYRMARKRNKQSNTIKSDIFIIAQKSN